MEQKGYTLIEIMVVVGSVSLIMMAVTGVILGSFRAQNRTKMDNKIMENGSWIINELRKNVFNSYSDEIECNDDGKSVQVMNLNDGDITTLSCREIDNKFKIASDSAKSLVLNNNEVEVVNCTNFVTCEKVGDKVSWVGFNFILRYISNNGIGASQVFSTKVTLRN